MFNHRNYANKSAWWYAERRRKARVEEAGEPTVELEDLVLSEDTISEDVAIGTVIGYLKSYIPGSTISVVSQSNPNMLRLQGLEIVVGSAGLSYEEESNPTITLKESYSHASGSTSHTTVIQITVEEEE